MHFPSPSLLTRYDTPWGEGPVSFLFENVLVMLSVYSFLLFFDMSANSVVTLFGIFVAVTMALVIAKYRRNKSTIKFDSLIGDKRSSVYQK